MNVELESGKVLLSIECNIMNFYNYPLIVGRIALIVTLLLSKVKHYLVSSWKSEQPLHIRAVVPLRTEIRPMLLSLLVRDIRCPLKQKALSPL